MQTKHRYLVVAGSALAIAAGGVGVAAATGGIGGGEGADDSVSGPAADRASAAALGITHGGTANSVERDTENGAAWEVEVTKPDGSTVDVRLDEGYGKVAVEADSGDGSEQGDAEQGDSPDPGEHEPAGEPDHGGEDGD